MSLFKNFDINFSCKETFVLKKKKKKENFVLSYSLDGAVAGVSIYLWIVDIHILFLLINNKHQWQKVKN